MNKLVIIFLLSLMVVVCKEQRLENKVKEPEKEVETVEEVPQKVIELALYEYNNNCFTKKSEYYSSMEEYKDIAVFSVLYTDQEVINDNKFKELWNNYYSKYDNISDYKLGYEISFEVENGKKFDETILKPLEYSHFSFCEYLYVWLYDDINQTASWYSHLEEDEYNDKTIMSSIKLMSTHMSSKITTPISLKVFVYKDLNDFDKNGKYIGNNEFTMLIKRV